MKLHFVVLGLIAMVMLNNPIYAFDWPQIDSGDDKLQPDSLTLCIGRSGLVFALGEGFRKADCLKNEKKFALNLTSSKGDKGDPGQQGPMGPKGDDGEEGPAGPTGIPGANGVNGIDGLDGVSGWEKIVATNDLAASDKIVIATCSASKKVIGGGYETTNKATQLYYSRPSVEGNSWEVKGYCSSSGYNLSAYAICVTAR